MPPPNTLLKNLLTTISAFFSGLLNKPKEERRKGEEEKGEMEKGEKVNGESKFPSNALEGWQAKPDGVVEEGKATLQPLESPFCDPLENMKIRKNRASNLFGVVRNNNTTNHQGFDYYAVPGTKIRAVADGVIKKIVNPANGDYGIQLTLKIDNTNYYAFYAHLLKVYDHIKLNTKVKKGDFLGETGNSGNAITCTGGDQHLHFECRTEIAPGLGLGGRVEPNLIVQTKFYTQNANKIQTNTGVIKVGADGKETVMKIE